MTITDDERDKLKLILRHYLKPLVKDVVDYDYAIDNREEVTDGENTYYKYVCPVQTIYLDSETDYAVTYDTQIVDTENDKYYYRFNDDPNVEQDIAFEYVTTYEWKNTSLPWLDTIGGS